MKFLTTFLLTSLLVVNSPAANAVPITGTFTITGSATINNPATSVDQAAAFFFSSITSYTGVPGSGTLGSLPPCVGSCGSGATLILTSMSPPYTFTASTPLFTLSNGVSFDLTSITNETRASAANNGGLALLLLQGTGLLHLAGFTDTAVTLSLQANGAAGSAVYTATVNPRATVVPEPATWSMLIGFGLMGGVLHRRRRAARLPVSA